MYKAQFSLVLCGSNERQYIGYCFVDRHFEKDELVDDCFSYHGVHEDPIASDLEEAECIDANKTIWDPRAYFLCIFEHRIVKVLKEWDDIVRNVVRIIERRMDQHVGTCSYLPLVVYLPLNQDRRASEGERSKADLAHFDWLFMIRELLEELDEGLSDTVKAWDEFRSSGGDSDYFRNSTSLAVHTSIRRHLRAIDDTFETLRCFHQKIVFLLERNQRSADRVTKVAAVLEEE